VPIHDLGYRTWHGRRTAPALRCLAIAETGIALAWRNLWVRRLVLVAWLPAVYLAIGFLLLEQGLAHQTEAELATGFLGQFPQAQMVLESLAKGDPLTARHEGWSWLLLIFLRYPQGFVMVLLVGSIAPGLIAKDVQSKAFLLYFSRPLTRVDYVLGKFFILAGYLSLITAVPALALYVLAVLLSPPELAVVGSTWDLPLRIVLASIVLTLPTVSLALAFSSLTRKTNYAGFAWFAVWFLGLIAYLIVSTSLENQAHDHWSLLSLYHTLGKVQTAVFGLPLAVDVQPNLAEVLPSAILLTVVTVGSMFVILRRVSSPMRV
jgi:hypothetical protein